MAAVATSAVRDAANRDEALAALSADGALDVRVLSRRGGGLVRLPRRGQQHHPRRRARARPGRRQRAGVARWWGAASERVVSRPARRRAHDRGASSPTPRGRARPDQGRCGATWSEALADVPWLDGAGGRMVGVGGTIRTLASMHQRRTRYPLDELHGYILTARAASRSWSTTWPSCPPPSAAGCRASSRTAPTSRSPGAVVISTILDRVGVEGVEICGQGLREGIFYERFLSPADPPLVGRRAPPERPQPGRDVPLRRPPRRRTSPSWPWRSTTSSPAWACSRSTGASASCCGPPGCSTTPACWWTTTTTTSTASTWC